MLDVCKGHGTWFDRDELGRIVAFVRAGGLSRARQKEKDDLEDARRRLRLQEQLLAARQRAPGSLAAPSGVGLDRAEAALDLVDALEAIGSVGGALGDLLGG